MNRIFPFVSRWMLAFCLLYVSGTGVFAQQSSEETLYEEVKEKEGYDPANTAFHHISDQNVLSLGFMDLPLPTILYAPGDGWSFFMSSRFGIGDHGNGRKAVDRYVLVEGRVCRVADNAFPAGLVELGDSPFSFDENEDGAELIRLNLDGNVYPLDQRSTLDGGLLGGGLTSFYDFSITKNVVMTILVMIFLFWIFRISAKRYEEDALRAPKGVQSLLEPIFIFIRDEVAKPFLGAEYLKYIPFLMTLFFLIFTLNLVGQIPFLGSSNVTGNLTVTLTLALAAFFVTNLSGNRSYWQHTFWMPGLPVFVKPILTVVEFIGLFIKPLTLTLRLAANITAGHIMLVVFVSILFIFNEAGQNLAGSVPGLFMAAPLTMFMMALELIVISVQAFVFTILTASYIGAAIAKDH